MYEARKKTHGNNAERDAEGKYLSTQKGNTGGNPQRVSDQIAQELGIGKNTVLRAARFAQGIDAIRKKSLATPNQRRFAAETGEQIANEADTVSGQKQQMQRQKNMSKLVIYSLERYDNYITNI